MRPAPRCGAHLHGSRLAGGYRRTCRWSPRPELGASRQPLAASSKAEASARRRWHRPQLHLQSRSHRVARGSRCTGRYRAGARTGSSTSPGAAMAPVPAARIALEGRLGVRRLPGARREGPAAPPGLVSDTVKSRGSSAGCRHGRLQGPWVESNRSGAGAAVEIQPGLPGMGLEPIRTCVRRFLRPLRLPLRHPGGVLLSGQGSGTGAGSRPSGLTTFTLSYADGRGQKQFHPPHAGPDPRLGAGLSGGSAGRGAGRGRR